MTTSRNSRPGRQERQQDKPGDGGSSQKKSGNPASVTQVAGAGTDDRRDPNA